MSKAPLLILGLRKTTVSSRYKALIWVLTFLVYLSYHLSRRPITVVKNALYSNCTLTPGSWHPNRTDTSIPELPLNESCLNSWAPFNNPSTHDDYFGGLDVAYLIAYAVGMFASGHIAERMNLRYFLTAGMLLSGLMTMAFGFGYLWNIHSFAYFIIVQIICGLVQSSGWPGVVACMGNWFGKQRRGLIMGIWNSHTSLGNIFGGIIASAYLTSYWTEHGYWWWSFFYPGLIIMVLGVVVFFLLVPHPDDVGITPEILHSAEALRQSENSEHSPLINDTESVVDSEDEHEPMFEGGSPANEMQAVSFIGALKVPGVIEFSFCLFFAKLVSYTFLYWLPQYIKQVMIHYVPMSDPDATAGELATLVDVGGIFGAIFAGFLADVTQSSAITCGALLILSIPMVWAYKIFGALSYANAYGLLIATGFFVNGPYCLITTSVSADLGTHPSLANSAKALATVTAIIDGTGSIGAALGPGLSAIVDGLNKPLSERMDIIFGMLIGSNLLALVLLSRLIYKEALVLKAKYKSRRYAA